MTIDSNARSGDWTDELLIPAPDGTRFDATADGLHIIGLEEARDGLVRVSWDGRSSDPFELFPQHSGGLMEWSPDGLHVAWYGARDGQFFVAIDGIEHPCEGITRSVPPTFSDAGGHVAYGVYVDGDARLVSDGQLLGDVRPAPIRPVFSADGKRFAFVAESRELKQGERPRDYRQWVVLDGVAQPEAEGISAADGHSIQFSPDGQRFAYSQIHDQHVRLIVDGVQSDPFEDLAFPTFSPDSRRLVYGIGSKDAFVFAGDGVVPGKSYRRIAAPVFSPDSTRVAYVGFRTKGHGVVITDGAESPEFDDLWDNVRFSPDSHHVAYLSMRKTGGFLSRSLTVNLVRDGRVGAPWDEVSSPPHFSPDSAHVAFSGRRAKHWFAALDDVPGPPFERVSPPRFSTTGRLGYVALAKGGTNGAYRIVADGIDTPVLADPPSGSTTESFLFSPDGCHVATAGLVDRLWRPMVDDAVGPGGSGAGSIRFDGDTVSFLVAMTDGAHRVSTELSVR